jgi:hypothetical protein
MSCESCEDQIEALSSIASSLITLNESGRLPQRPSVPGTNGQIVYWNSVDARYEASTSFLTSGMVSSVNAATGAVTLTVINSGTSGSLQWSGTQLQIPTSDIDTTGLLTGADWTTFNSKPSGSGATDRVALWTAASTLSYHDNIKWLTSNTLDVTGTVKASTQFLAGNGSVSAPSYAYTNSTNTGEYYTTSGSVYGTSPTVATWNVAAAGVRLLEVNNSGILINKLGGLIRLNGQTTFTDSGTPQIISGKAFGAFGNSSTGFLIRMSGGLVMVGPGVSVPTANLHIIPSGIANESSVAASHVFKAETSLGALGTGSAGSYGSSVAGIAITNTNFDYWIGGTNDTNSKAKLYIKSRASSASDEVLVVRSNVTVANILQILDNGKFSITGIRGTFVHDTASDNTLSLTNVGATIDTRFNMVGGNSDTSRNRIFWLSNSTIVATIGWGKTASGTTVPEYFYVGRGGSSVDGNTEGDSGFRYGRTANDYAFGYLSSTANVCRYDFMQKADTNVGGIALVNSDKATNFRMWIDASGATANIKFNHLTTVSLTIASTGVLTVEQGLTMADAKKYHS